MTTSINFLHLNSVILRLVFTLFVIISLSCNEESKKKSEDSESISSQLTVAHIEVLGIAQDAGFPQINCTKKCCAKVWSEKQQRKMVSCLGLRDPITNKVWIIDATPDFKDQLQILLKPSLDEEYVLGGIFLTHAHMGHYTGLIHLGREALGSSKVPVYAMPKMEDFLRENGPWSQLVTLENISLKTLTHNEAINLTDEISIKPLLVPHRDEFSETVGYIIQGLSHSALFIPDIDKWEKWNIDINEKIKEVDIAFVDGSFYQNGEIPGRDMSEIPHPFISESITIFDQLEESDQHKVHFIHLNHTNPLLDQSSNEFSTFSKLNYSVANEGQIFQL